MNIEKQYLNLLSDILDNGTVKTDRTGTGTISVFGRQIRHKMSDGKFPLLTTKKMHFKGIVAELLWFMRGETDIRELWKMNCHIWDGDFHKRYCKNIYSPYTLEELIDKGLNGNDKHLDKNIFDLGKIYGYQWRYWQDYSGNHIDQLANAINDLKNNPDSRRIIVNAWNPADLNDMILPPCHTFFQFYTRELNQTELNILYNKRRGTGEVDTNYSIGTIKAKDTNIPTRAISLMFNMRSNDFPLGNPYNIASYALLLEIIAKTVNMIPDELIGNLGDTHIYLNQIDGVKTQLEREPYELPTLKHMKTDEFYKSLGEDLSLLYHLDVNDFVVENYKCHPAIKFPLSN